MKIDAIDFSKELQQELGNYLGLENIKMSRLARTIVVAGANGGGKSRLLNLLNNHSQTRQNFESNKEQAKQYKDAIDSQPSSPNVTSWRNTYVAHNNIVQLFEAIKTSNNFPISPAIYHTKNTTLTSANSFGSEQVNAYADILRQIGIVGFTYVPSYVLSIFQRAVYASNPEVTASQEEISLAVNTKNSLRSLIDQFLGSGANALFTIEGYVTLFGHKDYEAKLSDGQKIILQLACALHAQNTKLSEAIIFFDEPENHLHPSALIDLIDSLEQLTSNGQLWIATHSVPLIAHLAKKDPNCLWYMENGSVSFAGDKPERVLEGLMGGRDGAQAIQEFRLLPEQLIRNRFLAECLIPPKSVSARIGDPQTQQILDKIKAKRVGLDADTKLKVLDYGAGKGRLIDALAAYDADTPLNEWLDYIAFDPYPDDKKTCLEALSRVYSNPDERHFNEMNDVNGLATAIPKASLDLIIMCNVLHEIHPDNWLKCFGSGADAQLTQLLKPNGSLLVVEDYEIPTGELAHEHGFFLLNTQELKELFAWQQADGEQFIRATAKEGRHKDRLVIHCIGKQLLERMTEATLAAAITALKRNADEKITRLQSEKASNISEPYKRGLQIGLAYQTYANAARWLTSK